MKEEKNEIIIKEMKESLDSIDNMSVKTPDMGFFRKMIAEAEGKKKEKRKKETIIFILSAIVILSIETYAFNQSFLFFIIIQSAALLSIPVAALALLKRKKGRERAT